MAKVREAFETAIREGAEKEEKQQKLPEVSQPDVPKPVRGGRMLAHFVGPHYINKDGERSIGLEFSFPLEKDHKGLIPRKVMDAWEVLKGGNVKRIDVKDVEPQTVGISIAPDDKEDLTLPAAEVTKASLSVIVEKGKGKTKEVHRFTVRFVVDRNKAIRDFIWNQDGESIWITMQRTQASLID